MYDPFSIKGPTRKDSGIGPRLVFDGDAKLPTDFSLFFKNDENKGDLNMLIAKHITNPDSWDSGKEVLVTYKKKVLARSDGIQEIYQWQEDVHKEADNRMIIHINHMLKNGISSITVRTLDTDVRVILLSFMVQVINIDEHASIMVDFGSGDSRRTISINRSFSELGNAVCLGLPFFHTLTGCDSTAAFYKKTKKVFYESWMDYNKHNDLTHAFQHLSWLPTTEMVQSSLKVVEQFVSHLYLKQELDSDKARFLMFSAATNLESSRTTPMQSCIEATHIEKCIPGKLDLGQYLVRKTSTVKVRVGLEHECR